MADLHPLVIVLLAIIGSLAVVAVGCALHRTLRPEEFTKPRFQAVSQEQSNFMHEVCARNREEAFAESGRPPQMYGGGYGPAGGGFDGRYSGMYSSATDNDGYGVGEYSNYSRV